MRRSIVAFSLALLVTGCKTAPEMTTLEGAPRAVTVGTFHFQLLLPVGAEQDQSFPTSSRFVVPGRGGALVHLSLVSPTFDLAGQTKNAAEASTPDGTTPVVVRSVVDKGRVQVTSQGRDGKLVRVTSLVPLTNPAGAYALQCHANVTRSKPIVDVEATRRALEEICDSVREPLGARFDGTRRARRRCDRMLLPCKLPSRRFAKSRFRTASPWARLPTCASSSGAAR